MRLDVRHVLARLTSEGLAPSGSEDAARAALASELADHLPWFMRAAVAIGAWFATIFMLISLLAFVRPHSDATWVVIGVVLMIGAVLLRRFTTSEFLKWAAVASALAGHGMATFGMGAIGADSFTRGAVTCVATAALLIWLVRDQTLRFIATLSGGSALVFLLIVLKVPQGIDVGIALLVAAVAWVWRGAVRRGDASAEILEPVGYGLMVVLFSALLGRTLTTSTHGHWSMDLGRELGTLGPIATIACTVALLALAWKVLDEHGASLSTPFGFALLAGAAALGAATLDSPGIVTGLAALMLAFDRRNRVLLGMATIFLIVFGSFYYYSLHLTLLQKSGVLVGSGLLLFGIRARVVGMARE